MAVTGQILDLVFQMQSYCGVNTCGWTDWASADTEGH